MVGLHPVCIICAQQGAGRRGRMSRALAASSRRPSSIPQHDQLRPQTQNAQEQPLRHSTTATCEHVYPIFESTGELGRDKKPPRRLLPFSAAKTTAVPPIIFNGMEMALHQVRLWRGSMRDVGAALIVHASLVRWQ